MELIQVYSDEASRWGADPYGRMVEEYKARKRRTEALAAAAPGEVQKRDAESARSRRTIELEPPIPVEEAPAPLPREPLAILMVGAPLRVRRIVAVVAAKYDVSVRDLLGPSRLVIFCNPRHLAMYLVKRSFGWSWPRVGNIIGGRDHTTVINAIRRIERMIADDEEFAAFVEAIKEEIGKL